MSVRDIAARRAATRGGSHDERGIDELDDDERDYAATHGRLPRRAVRRLKRLWG